MFWSTSVDSPFPSGRFIVINRDCTSFPGVVLQLHQHNQHTNPKHPTRALTECLCNGIMSILWNNVFKTLLLFYLFIYLFIQYL